MKDKETLTKQIEQLESELERLERENDFDGKDFHKNNASSKISSLQKQIKKFQRQLDDL